MTKSANDLLTQALRLSDEDRAELVERLLESLEPESTDSDDDIEAEWGKEIQKRIEELDSGKEKAIPWEEARRLIEEGRDEFGEP